MWQKRYLLVLLAGGGASSLLLGLEPVFTVTRDPGLKPAARCGIANLLCQLSQYSELAPTNALTQKNLFRNFCRQSLHIGMLLREDISAGEAVFKHIFSSGFFLCKSVPFIVLRLREISLTPLVSL